MKSINKIEQIKKSAIIIAAIFTAAFIIVVQPASLITLSANSHLHDTCQSSEDSNTENSTELNVGSYEATVPVVKQLNRNQEVALLWESPLQEKKFVWTEILTPDPIVRFSKVLFRRIISPNAP